MRIREFLRHLQRPRVRDGSISFVERGWKRVLISVGSIADGNGGGVRIYFESKNNYAKNCGSIRRFSNKSEVRHALYACKILGRFVN